MRLQQIEPVIRWPDGAAAADLCAVSADVSVLAFWVAGQGDGAAGARGLYVGELEWEEDLGEAAERVWAGRPGASVSELSWSPDGAWLAMLLSSGPPPGELRIGVLRLADRAFSEMPGMSFAWTGAGATLLIADPAASRVYAADLGQGGEAAVGKIVDDGDPHFAPVIAASPDGTRAAVVTRRVGEPSTFVDLVHRPADAWQVTPLTHLPDANLRLLPFWSADAAAMALLIVDLGRGQTTVLAVPADDGPGEILYASPTLDGVVVPATHPGGRLIAMVRDHADAEGGAAEKRIVLVDPVERAIAAVPGDGGSVRRLRWLDPETLLAEGTATAWTVTLRIKEVVADGS